MRIILLLLAITASAQILPMGARTTFGGGGGGGITPGVHASAGSTDGVHVTTPARDTTGASLIVCACSVYPGIVTPPCTDSQSNTWTPKTAYASTLVSIQLWYVRSPTTSASHTFSCEDGGGNSSFPAIAAMAFSGTRTASDPFDAENGASSNAASLATGSITPSSSGELIISAVSTNDSTGPFTNNAGLTVVEELVLVGAQHVGVGFAYLVQGGAAAINPTWTLGSSAPIAVTVAAFKAP